MLSEKLIEQIEKRLKEELNGLEEIPSPTSVKGSSYEDVFKTFFEKYLGSIYDFHTRVSILDYLGLHSFIFKPIENEFDLVATYKTSVPKVFLEHANVKYIPYDAIAFITQIKQDLDKNKLQIDLQKLKKLRLLPLNPNRFPVSTGLRPMLSIGASTERPLNILIYINQRIKSDTVIRNTLRESKDCWDFVVVMSRNLLYVNYQVLKPLIEQLVEVLRKVKTKLDVDLDVNKLQEEIREKVSREPFEVIEKYPLISIINLIPHVLPYPIICNASSVFFLTLFTPEIKESIEETLKAILEEKERRGNK